MKCELRTEDNRCLADGGSCPAEAIICRITRAGLSEDLPMVEGLFRSLKPKRSKRATKTIENLMLMPALKN